MKTDNTLHRTKDYAMFESHPYQRPAHKDAVLLASMRKYGFMPSSPIQVVRNGGKTLKVIRGHHRLDFAKRLKLPVYYIIDNSNTDIYLLEGSSQVRWSASDHAHSRARAGEEDYIKLVEFQKRHGLTLGAAASLLGGQSAGSNNRIRNVKFGDFTVVQDQSHANAVVRITDDCYKHGVSFARSSAFVSAVSAALRVPAFDPAVFLHRVSLYGANINRRSRVDQYLEEIEALYNYGAKGKRIPLAHEAREVMRQRGVLKSPKHR